MGRRGRGLMRRMSSMERVGLRTYDICVGGVAD